MALSLTRPVPLGLHSPHNFLWASVLGGLQEVIAIQMCHEASLEATNVYCRFTQRLGGVTWVPFQVSVNICVP
jgi:hypothetical protein